MDMTRKLNNSSILRTNNRIEKINFNSGDGLKFDGVNDYVNCGGSVFNYEYSINIIFNIDTTKSFPQTLFSIFKPTSNHNGFQLVVWDINIIRILHRFPYNDTGGNDNYITLNYDTLGLNIFTVTVSSNSIKFYVNGVLFYIKNQVNTLFDATTLKMFIGKLSESLVNVRYFKGEIYDLKIFNKELTQSEVTKLYQTQGQLIPATAMPYLKADWRFEDKQGTVLKDRSGNNYDGTLTNFANTTLGVSNAWINKYGNSIQQL